ncbi:MAG: sulfite exporter TauE/SafE family protein [Planctomycetia bacterium]|nr:sulfite exporter TauE/SafE family protein [Planctomycetia bacterium]
MVWIVLIGSAFLAGAINTMAGGGTLLTFPALQLFGGLLPVQANASSTISLVSGSLAGAWGYRRELGGSGLAWLRLLILPSVVGGAVGALLVSILPNTVFRAVLPWLLLTAAVLFLLQPLLARWTRLEGAEGLPSTGGCVAAVFFQLVVALYGGYFGAGIGILMLTSLGVMGLGDIHRANAIKTLLAAAINGVSVLVFVLAGTVVWWCVVPMTLGAIAGGYAGAAVGRRLPKVVVRWFVISVAFALSGYYFVRG